MTESPLEEKESQIKRICRILLESQEKIIKEKELLNLVQNDEDQFQEVISEVTVRFEKIGYELIRTNYMEDIYYLLATTGMDKTLTPQMYGILALIFSFQKEFSRELTMEEAKDIFKSSWEEVTFLMNQNYLHEYLLQNQKYLIITPIGKVLFKDVLSDITLDLILDNLGI
ncbi:MAG: hypothetical protein JW776_03350 [Candidatus Lokiarchaeota archaeon]|nr:hypothetical protein [Candidatus Lokiarchaeota archaeon]